MLSRRSCGSFPINLIDASKENSRWSMKSIRSEYTFFIFCFIERRIICSIVYFRVFVYAINAVTPRHLAVDNFLFLKVLSSVRESYLWRKNIVTRRYTDGTAVPGLRRNPFARHFPDESVICYSIIIALRPADTVSPYAGGARSKTMIRARRNEFVLNLRSRNNEVRAYAALGRGRRTVAERRP